MKRFCFAFLLLCTPLCGCGGGGDADQVADSDEIAQYVKDNPDLEPTPPGPEAEL